MINNNCLRVPGVCPGCLVMQRVRGLVAAWAARCFIGIGRIGHTPRRPPVIFSLMHPTPSGGGGQDPCMVGGLAAGVALKARDVKGPVYYLRGREGSRYLRLAIHGD